MSRTIALLTLLVAPRVLAEPATIRIFEAAAHERPEASSPVLHTFAERTEVSVSEEAEQGFRKVRLPDGKVGYVAESALRFTAQAATTVTAGSAPTAPGTPAAATSAPTPTPSLLPTKVIVKDLPHLAELIKPDPEVGPMGAALVARNFAADATIYSSLAAGVVLTAVGFLVVPKNNCYFRPGGEQSCSMGTSNLAVAGAGLGVVGVGSIVGMFMKPGRNELIDVLNAWNVRHPDEPFEVTPVVSGR